MSIIRKGYAETSEGQVHYREVHRVSGTPLVLLHQTARVRTEWSSLSLLSLLIERCLIHVSLNIFISKFLCFIDNSTDSILTIQPV